MEKELSELKTRVAILERTVLMLMNNSPNYNQTQNASNKTKNESMIKRMRKQVWSKCVINLLIEDLDGPNQ